MNKINVFEGSRRVATVLKVLWVVAVAIITWNSNSPHVSLHFVTDYPNQGFRRVAYGGCQSGVDAQEFVQRDFAEGREAFVTLCFKARPADDGTLVIPTEVESDKRWFGYSLYSASVTNYTKTRSRAFALTEEDKLAAQQEGSRQTRKGITDGILWAVGGWVGLWLLQVLVGWVVRGFLGIPLGADRRPAPTEPAELT